MPVLFIFHFLISVWIWTSLPRFICSRLYTLAHCLIHNILSSLKRNQSIHRSTTHINYVIIIFLSFCPVVAKFATTNLCLVPVFILCLFFFYSFSFAKLCFWFAVKIALPLSIWFFLLHWLALIKWTSNIH